MTIKSAQVMAALFTLRHPTTGAAADATGTPTGALYVNGVLNAATVTVTKPTGTGLYLASLTLPTLMAGQQAALLIAATVAGVSITEIVWRDMADADTLWTGASTRTLTSSAAATTAAVSGSTLTVTRFATYSAELSGLTIPADWLEVWLTAKTDAKDLDSAAVLQVLESNPGAVGDGVQHLEGAAGTAADGSLTVDQVAGTVTLALGAATDGLSEHTGLYYDVKVSATAAGEYQLATGVMHVQTAVTRAR